MERLANAVGSRLATQLNLDNDRKEQVSYGAYVLLQSGSTFILILFIGALLGVLRETLVVALTGAALRSVSGGVHLKGAVSCIIASAVAFGLCGLAANGLRELTEGFVAWQQFIGFGLVSAAAFLVVMRYAPVEAAMRPLKAEHKARLRISSMRLAAIYGAVFATSAAIGLWWAVPAVIGFGFQSFTLTPAGHRFISALDNGIDAIARR